MGNTYFIPTPKYKKYLVLDIINKNSDLTQRDIAALVGISLSMVNMCRQFDLFFRDVNQCENALCLVIVS